MTKFVLLSDHCGFWYGAPSLTDIPLLSSLYRFGMHYIENTISKDSVCIRCRGYVFIELLPSNGCLHQSSYYIFFLFSHFLMIIIIRVNRIIIIIIMWLKMLYFCFFILCLCFFVPMLTLQMSRAVFFLLAHSDVEWHNFLSSNPADVSSNKTYRYSCDT
jgi:hypothetical protein